MNTLLEERRKRQKQKVKGEERVAKTATSGETRADVTDLKKLVESVKRKSGIADAHQTKERKRRKL